MGTWRLLLTYMVVAVHVEGYSDLFSVELGVIAVSTFFFISGFLMPLAYNSFYNSKGFMGASTRFYINRFLKIYPIYWVSLLVILAQYWASDFLHNYGRLDHIDPATYIQNFLLIGLNQTVFWGGYDRFNNPAWTLDVELQYYLLVPFIMILASKFRSILNIVLFILCAISLYLYFNPAELVDIDKSLLSLSVFFIMGFVFYEATARKLPSNSVYIVALLIAALSLAAGSGRGIETLLITSIFMMVSAFLLTMQKDYKFGRLDRLAGDLSYPTYILHIAFFGPTIKLLTYSPLGSLDVFPRYALTCLIHVVVSTGVGYLALKFISQPIDKVRVRVKG